MKLFRIEDEEDLWCEYGSAYEAILNLMSSSFPDQAKSKWALDKAYVNWRGDSYTVNATFTRFDEAVRDVVMVGCNAEGNRKNELIKTSCGVPIPVEYDSWKKEYSPKGAG
ncbi:hypothetical protein HV318_03670 [Enterobacter sp. RHBSTW-00901]|uniref:hypothetical protein n=1 Tax=Enterobacter sp. RHBSTW-00901 TaxID=2742669 RepID=UPI0015F6C11B|nr:hypothetical protein [Enterobacter sp. RHBSTW-00901]MBA7854146.1 hypothetical protein [Enterobacter sp. RHBSTW-00901]